MSTLSPSPPPSPGEPSHHLPRRPGPSPHSPSGKACERGSPGVLSPACPAVSSWSVSVLRASNKATCSSPHCCAGVFICSESSGGGRHWTNPWSRTAQSQHPRLTLLGSSPPNALGACPTAGHRAAWRTSVHSQRGCRQLLPRRTCSGNGDAAREVGLVLTTGWTLLPHAHSRLSAELTQVWPCCLN